MAAYRRILMLLVCKRGGKATQAMLLSLLKEDGVKQVIQIMNSGDEVQLRKMAAMLLIKLLDKNPKVQERISEQLGFDLVYASDGVARVCLNKIPQKFVKMLRSKGTSLKVILEQINKIEYNATKKTQSWTESYWFFP